MISKHLRRARLLAAGAALVSIAVVVTPAAQATHEGVPQLGHFNYGSSLIVGARIGDPNQFTLRAGGPTIYDPALLVTSYYGDPVGRDAIEARTSALGRSAVYAHHDGTSNSGTGVTATSILGDGVNATTQGAYKSALWAHHEGTNQGYGVFAQTKIGTGIQGTSADANGVGVVAENTAGGAALRVNGRAYLNGNVGIGLSSPVSKLQVVGNYVQLPYRTTAPPASDCDETKEAGRMMVRSGPTAPNLYICRGTAGWRGL